MTPLQTNIVQTCNEPFYVQTHRSAVWLTDTKSLLLKQTNQILFRTDLNMFLQIIYQIRKKNYICYKFTSWIILLTFIFKLTKSYKRRQVHTFLHQISKGIKFSCSSLYMRLKIRRDLRLIAFWFVFFFTILLIWFLRTQ